ncbi:MAG: hypothetical protein JXR48_08940 [Candidatus Delongbacteria bacterium]|nr:hypothetical protein [Candidatus Delongbacteria bacterium]MBN2835076.1 hypothetical protein [Candidatus Delongbacteria bacterium]
MRYLIILILLNITLMAKVPFATLYVEFKKTRFEGDSKLLQDWNNNVNKLSRFESMKYIWVDVENESYLEITEPLEGNTLIEKEGKLKYKGKHYTLDYESMIAVDLSDLDRIYDDYTTETPDYLYYKGVLERQATTKGNDNVKRNANYYTYFIEEPGTSENYKAQKEMIMNSDLPEKEKNFELRAIEEEILAKSTKVKDYIWVDSDMEMGMALKKIVETQFYVEHTNVNKIDPNKVFDTDIFAETLSKFKIKTIEK